MFNPLCGIRWGDRLLGKHQKGSTRRAFPSGSSLLDRHHGQVNAQISVRGVWRCTDMFRRLLAADGRNNPRHGSHPLLLSRALSQAILLFGRRRLGTHQRGTRDRNLASSEVGMTRFRTHRSHSEDDPRDAKHEQQFTGTLRCRVPFGHAAVPTDAVVLGHEAPRSAGITLSSSMEDGAKKAARQA